MPTKITILKNGPVLIEDEGYISTDNKVFAEAEVLRKKIAICRCGLSENGVYCDGSHAKKSESDKNKNE